MEEMKQSDNSVDMKPLDTKFVFIATKNVVRTDHRKITQMKNIIKPVEMP